MTIKDPVISSLKKSSDIGHASLGSHYWTNIVSTLLLLGIHSLNVLLAHYIAVNTSHRSFGYYKPGIQALIALD
jgi:hypothetical protein